MKNKTIKPFIGKKIYFSISITVVTVVERDLGNKLVQYMKKNGAEVLDDFVGARSKEEFFKMFANKTGHNITESPESRVIVRKTDIKYVDEATHLIVVVDDTSFGVGMEIQRAIDKPKMGLPATPILCLVREDLLTSLTPMIRGISKEEALGFELKTYKNINEAKSIIYKFLTL